ncbi:hypothetical protein [Nocardiopsis sp. CC223A]|uniref:hypothetical protein n=1 Tax=Nocardiopsis sp. CC223A TaxID=3044051 RepID=UPI00278BD08E|nr:hypothetical protein [Nocardiopsis sp. CC223A]
MTEQNPWPTRRAGRATVLAQFGRARADLMQWALTTGDALADAVVAEMHRLGTQQDRPVVDQGIREGLASLTDPPRHWRRCCGRPRVCPTTRTTPCSTGDPCRSTPRRRRCTSSRSTPVP